MAERSIAHAWRRPELRARLHRGTPRQGTTRPSVLATRSENSEGSENYEYHEGYEHSENPEGSEDSVSNSLTDSLGHACWCAMMTWTP